MRRKTVQRFMDARRLAKQCGLELSESGQCNGERRVYSLCVPSGPVFFETSDIGAIEARVEKELGRAASKTNVPAKEG
jgi:hypothetical protein